MAIEGSQPVKLVGATAGADLSAASAQYKFVKFTADNSVILCAATTDIPCGVLQNSPTSGAAADVLVVGETKLQCAAASAAGSLVGPDASGLARINVPGTDTTKYIVGQIVVANAAANGYATAVVNCASPSRAA